MKHLAPRVPAAGKKVVSVSLIFTFILLVGPFTPNLVAAQVNVKQSTPTVWHVLAGGQTSDASLQGMGFYPNVITIDFNDTIVWSLGGSEPHTVTFLSGTTPPLPGSPEAEVQKGGPIYNGKDVVSSGLMVPPQSYTLTFTQPGVYVYNCLLHPGMQGVVIVQPADTPYPYTQADYSGQGYQQLQADLHAGQDAINNYHISTAPGPNGTTIYHIAAGLGTPENAATALHSENNSTATGKVALSLIGPMTLQVDVTVTGLAPNSVHPEHIHSGTCSVGGPILYPLNDLQAGPDGKAISTTIVQGILAIPEAGWFVNVHTGPTLDGAGAVPIACGDISYQNAATMRFHPGMLVVHVGDQVVWTQYAANEAHTVTFVPAGMAIPDFPSPQSVTPSGNATGYDGTGYFNSGLLLPGQSYVLTFTKPGIYTYLCILHDDLNMVGYVEVLPSVTGTTTVVQQSAGTDVVAWVALVMAVVLGGMALALARRRFR